jgi:hypothetical protein
MGVTVSLLGDSPASMQAVATMRRVEWGLGSHTVHVAYSGDASFAASAGSTPIAVVH